MSGNRRSLVGDERAELAKNLREKYLSGRTVRQLAEAHSLSYGRTQKLLLEAGTEMRPRGGANRGPRDAR